jgi:hypothetical protein
VKLGIQKTLKMKIWMLDDTWNLVDGIVSIQIVHGSRFVLKDLTGSGNPKLSKFTHFSMSLDVGWT